MIEMQLQNEKKLAFVLSKLILHWKLEPSGATWCNNQMLLW